MSNKNTEDNLRDRYFSNEIFRIGDLVEDTKSGELMKILDRGSNYVTVATNNAIVKKWLYEVSEQVTQIVEEVVLEVVKEKSKDFELLESGQIRLFGYDTQNFDSELSEFIIEQFSEFTDLYSQHQIIKCLDLAMTLEESSEGDRIYELLGKVDKFYSKQNMSAPLIVEVLRNETERTRIAEILATLADIKPSKANSQTVTSSIKALKEKYQTRKQWEVLIPFLKLAQESGLTGALQNLPYGVATFSVREEYLDDVVIDALTENFELLVEDLEYDDISEAFDTEDYSDELISETLSVETRNKLSIKLKQHAPQLEIRRDRALNRAASTGVLMQRARRLAEVMLKRRIFHKPVSDMTRQEKERFEGGASKRKTLVAKLAQRLVGKVRMLQNNRLHHSATPASHTHDKATSANHAAVSGVGAS